MRGAWAWADGEEGVQGGRGVLKSEAIIHMYSSKACPIDQQEARRVRFSKARLITKRRVPLFLFLFSSLFLFFPGWVLGGRTRLTRPSCAGRRGCSGAAGRRQHPRWRMG